MKMFSWVQSKFNGRQGKRLEVGPSSSHYISKENSNREEFEDWPQTFLAIGTFGNNALQEDSQIAQNSSETQELSHKISDLNIEDVIRLQKEISKLVNLKLNSSTDGAETDEMKIADRSLNESLINGSKDDSDDFKIIQNNLKYLLFDDHNEIKRRSFFFLLKKIFVSKICLSSRQSLRDSIPESKLEKILRKIIHKKIHPQTIPRPPPMRYLQKNKEEEKAQERCKWVKTDSEYIVLEI